MTHVLHVMRPAQGGLRQHLRLLAEHWPEPLAIAGPGSLADDPAWAGRSYTVVEVPRRPFPLAVARAVRQLQRAIARHQPDILHAHGLQAGLVARLAVVGSPGRVRPLVLSVHNLPPARRPAPDYALTWMQERVLGRLTAAYVAVSEAVGARLQSDYGVASERVRVIYSGIDTQRFAGLPDRPVARARLGLPPDGRLVGCVARLSPEKGLATLLTALSQLAAPPRLALVGEGPARAPLAARARALGLAEYVHFLGQREDIPLVLAACDAYVQPSLTEGLGMAVLEAMASGLPVVVSAVGGLPEAVEEGRTGWLVPPGDAAALARALQRVLAAPGSCGAAARREVAARFAIAHTVRALQDLYGSLRNGG